MIRIYFIKITHTVRLIQNASRKVLRIQHILIWEWAFGKNAKHGKFEEKSISNIKYCIMNITIWNIFNFKYLNSVHIVSTFLTAKQISKLSSAPLFERFWWKAPPRGCGENGFVLQSKLAQVQWVRLIRLWWCLWRWRPTRRPRRRWSSQVHRSVQSQCEKCKVRSPMRMRQLGIAVADECTPCPMKCNTREALNDKQHELGDLLFKLYEFRLANKFK